MAFEIKSHKTLRGFAKGEFTDASQRQCTIQESSRMGEDCIWLGMHEPDLQRFIGEGKGWEKFELPAGVSGFSRMHLNREMAGVLADMLKEFSEKGYITAITPEVKT